MNTLTVSVSELRRHFDAYMNRIKSGEVVVVTKYGKPVAEFVPAQIKQKSYRPKQKKAGVKVESSALP